MTRLSLLLVLTMIPAALASQQRLDSTYTARIRELTPTDSTWQFTTELVDHLPASATVPTPLAVLGYVPGTVGHLSHVADINRYFHALEAASPRVKVFSLGLSDEGRDMLLVAIADSATIAHLDDYRGMVNRLADPRGLADTARARLVRSAKPVYWLTGSIHSPETGSPEMLMELGYRLAVEESDWVRDIRRNVITLITPVIEVDGRDRAVDAYHEGMRLGLGPRGVNLIYWGKYAAHDNNRDAVGVSQLLTQHVMAAFLHWTPTVMHDLHESVAFLYTSTGTGPYNEQFDPIVIDEWHTLAYQEITELTRRGLPGVWTHGFYDGWTPNYMLAIANLHNSIGKFYETYTSQGAECHTADLNASQTERTWDRPNPPVNGVRWCIRSNINYQQSGVLVALKYVADHRETFMTNFAAKSQRIVDRGRTSAPYAFVIPHDQRRAAEAADLVNLFREHGTEVQVASRDATLGDSAHRVVVHQGDWVIRMDQPYTQVPRTLLAVQDFKSDYPTPYDDTGWTISAMRHVEVRAVSDSAVLGLRMQLLTADVSVTGQATGRGDILVVRHLGDWRSALVPWRLAPMRVAVADTAFELDHTTYPAGTFVIEHATDSLRSAITALGLDAVATRRLDVSRHDITLPRVALLHTWIETQNEGWVRYALDQFGIPYVYLSDQDLRTPGILDQVDVVVFPHVSGPATTLLNGRPMAGPPIPWRHTDSTPNLGRIDETDDMRPGMGLEGAAALQHFVEHGGLLLTEGNSDQLPVTLGFNPTVSIRDTRALRVRGSVVRAEVAERGSPILYGYEQSRFPVYFTQAPVLSVQTGGGRFGGNQNELVDSTITAEREHMRARAILRYPRDVDSILVSGQLQGGSELAGQAAVVDAPVGNGHVVLFGIRPFWRWSSQGSFAMALNAIANWNHLEVRETREARPARRGG